MIMKMMKMITNSMRWDQVLILITQATNLKEVTQQTGNPSEWNHLRVFWTCWCRKIKFSLTNIGQEVYHQTDLQQRNTKKIQTSYHLWKDSNIFLKTSLQLMYLQESAKKTKCQSSVSWRTKKLQSTWKLGYKQAGGKSTEIWSNMIFPRRIRFLYQSSYNISIVKTALSAEKS